jgi:hypothetical protein
LSEEEIRRVWKVLDDEVSMTVRNRA